MEKKKDSSNNHSSVPLEAVREFISIFKKLYDIELTYDEAKDLSIKVYAGHKAAYKKIPKNIK